MKRSLLVVLALFSLLLGVAPAAQAAPTTPVAAVQVAAVHAVPAVPSTTQTGIWWSAAQYPNGIGIQMQYQVMYVHSVAYVRVVGFTSWVTDGSCFTDAQVGEGKDDDTIFVPYIYYSWPNGVPCHHQITVDANAGHGYTTAQMPWMTDSVGHMEGTLFVALTGNSTDSVTVIGG
jgi:hypothetical protein